MQKSQMTGAIWLSLVGIVLYGVLRLPSATHADENVRQIPTDATQVSEESIRPYMHAKLVRHATGRRNSSQ